MTIDAHAEGPEGYRTFDHTADLGLEVWAPTPERLFARAAEAVSAQVARVPEGPPAAARPLRVDLSLEGEDAEDLLVHWLNTVLARGEIERAVWTRAEVVALSGRRLEAALEGERLDPARHVTLREVKAVSHHELRLDLAPGSCRCRLVLDL